MNELDKNKELERLVDEQQDDMSTRVLYPETITPLPVSMLEGLTLKEKASIILSVIGRIRKVDIGRLFNCTSSSINRYIQSGYRKLKDKYKDKKR